MKYLYTTGESLTVRMDCIGTETFLLRRQNSTDIHVQMETGILWRYIVGERFPDCSELRGVVIYYFTII